MQNRQKAEGPNFETQKIANFRVHLTFVPVLMLSLVGGKKKGARALPNDSDFRARLFPIIFPRVPFYWDNREVADFC